MRGKKLLLIIFALIIFLQFSVIAKADVASDIAAGVPLPQIIQKSALCAGMTLEKAIIAIIKGGVEPEAVVYTAITERYPVNIVVMAAIKSGSSLDSVVKGAIGAGAKPETVSAAAVKAGADPSAVADAIARHSALRAGGLGYSPPPTAAPAAFPAVPAGVITGGGPIGGGGGGAPASPYKP